MDLVWPGKLIESSADLKDSKQPLTRCCPQCNASSTSLPSKAFLTYLRSPSSPSTPHTLVCTINSHSCTSGLTVIGLLPTNCCISYFSFLWRPNWWKGKVMTRWSSEKPTVPEGFSYLPWHAWHLSSFPWIQGKVLKEGNDAIFFFLQIG